MADDAQLECGLLWCWTWASVTDASTISGMNETRTKRCARQILLNKDDRTSNVCEIEYGKSCAKA
jgi:hypothetical protein